MTAVAFDGVSFSYPGGRAPVLDEVTLSLDPGRFVLVAGATGAGKSTLLRAVNGLVPHFTGGRWAGRVLVAGRNTLDHPPRSLADVVAYVPQQPDASFVLDRVEDELAYAMENLGRPPAVMRRRVEEMLDLLRIESLRDRSVRTLSGGERQRVAIAAALTAGARVLVLDEPTSQLDPQGAEDVLAALQRLVHDLGLTALVAEHRLERVAGFADDVVACHSSGRVTVGAPRDVLPHLSLGPPVATLGRLLEWDPVPLTVRDARSRAAGMHLPPRVASPGGAPAQTIASAHEMSARYGPVAALKSVDLELDAGQITAVVGRNGSGKTTLLRCLAGLHDAAHGRVVLLGRAPAPGRTVVLVGQDPDAALFAETVHDEVAATLQAHGRDTGEVKTWLDRLGIAALDDTHPRDASAGERVLIAVAALAAVDAPLLLLDEPTRGLDRAAKLLLGRFLRARARAGRAVMFSSHDVEFVASLAARVVHLAGGEVVDDGRPEDVLADSAVFAPQMARVFGAPWLTVEEVAGALGVRVDR